MRRYQDMSTKRLKQHRATIDGILAARGSDKPTFRERQNDPKFLAWLEQQKSPVAPPPDRAEPEKYEGGSRWVIFGPSAISFAVVTGLDLDVHESGMDNILLTFVNPPDYEAWRGCRPGSFTRAFMDRFAKAWDSPEGLTARRTGKPAV